MNLSPRGHGRTTHGGSAVSRVIIYKLVFRVPIGTLRQNKSLDEMVHPIIVYRTTTC